MFHLTCTSISSPPTTVQWTIDGIPVNGSDYSSSQIVIDGLTATYNNTLTVTGRAPGMYTCFITTTCSPVCGAAGFNPSPRYITSSLTVLGKYYMCKEHRVLMDVCLFFIQLLLTHPLVSLLSDLVRQQSVSLGQHQPQAVQ